MQIFMVDSKEVGQREFDGIPEEVVLLDFDTAKSILQHDYFDPCCKNFKEAVFVIVETEANHTKQIGNVYYEFLQLQ